MGLQRKAFLSTTNQEKNLVTTEAVNGVLEREMEQQCTLRIYSMASAIFAMTVMKMTILMTLSLRLEECQIEQEVSIPNDILIAI